MAHQPATRSTHAGNPCQTVQAGKPTHAGKPAQVPQVDSKFCNSASFSAPPCPPVDAGGAAGGGVAGGGVAAGAGEAPDLRTGAGFSPSVLPGLPPVVLPGLPPVHALTSSSKFTADFFAGVSSVVVGPLRFFSGKPFANSFYRM